MVDDRDGRRADARRGSRTVPVTVIIPSKDEESNIGAALESVSPATEVIVVDSRSVDRTCEIALELGAHVVPFDYVPGGPKKKSWALRELQPANEWVLFLDADERVTQELWQEIESAISSEGIDGFCLDREFIFLGQPMRCFRPNWNLRLFRWGKATMEDLGLHDLPGTGDNEIHEHFSLVGPCGFLCSALLHNDYRGLTQWLDRHNKYATWEAHLYKKLREESFGPLDLLRIFSADAFRRKRLLRRLWVRIPCRPLLRFLVWYVVRGGILDGLAGARFCALMFSYELTISIKLEELEKE